MRWFDELQRISSSPETAARIRLARNDLDVTDLARQVTVATLVLHARDDLVVPFAEGRLLASLIPAARFVPLEGRNHILLADEPAWPVFLRELQVFPCGFAAPVGGRADVLLGFVYLACALICLKWTFRSQMIN